ncbi:MAG: ABC transporter permease [Candidatus Baldrarchaeia archaeon]
MEKNVEISKNYIYGSEEFSPTDFLAPSFSGFIAMFFTFIISGILFLRERLMGTLERMLASATTHTEIVLGYLISFLIVATIQSTIITLVTLIFSTKILENFLQIYTLVLLLAMGSVSLSIFLSSYMKTELQVVQMIPIYIVPQIFLSGLIFSLKALPEFLRPLAYILPLTYYVDAVKKIIYINATLTNILPQLTILTAYFILGIILGIKKFRKEIT